ncbi:palmitoyltransferase ZDHHC16-like [Diaphorina citri]|uniref:Palmitoyltransferase n=3 Tax=Diaphorina citri TaxID=121845 RepID=A0A1S3CW42_DIACI|nr:palmitoyltransferase ZDHHC16-like [Diaphorina citri]
MGDSDGSLRACLFRVPLMLFSCVSIFSRSFFNNYILAEGGMTHAFVEPIFWVVDSVLISIGPFLTVLVIFISGFTVFIAYWILFPFYRRQSEWLAYTLAVIGNWILINFVFNYYMGFSTSPGHPPKHSVSSKSSDVCKKCLTPKPPRTHHCSICDQCILKMDHHCPWMNHCVGHWNHRYFYMFMIYTLLGCAFLFIIGYRPAYSILVANSKHFDFHYENVHDVLAAIPEGKLGRRDTMFFRSSFQPMKIPLSYYLETYQFRYKSLMFLSLVLCVIFCAVLTLSLWHAKLISGGETSVEFLKNKYEMTKKKKEGGTFKNPFDFGWKTNWRIFLGLYGGRTIWRHILLPSTHKPLDNGVTWTTSEDIQAMINGKPSKDTLHSC